MQEQVRCYKCGKKMPKALYEQHEPFCEETDHVRAIELIRRLFDAGFKKKIEKSKMLFAISQEWGAMDSGAFTRKLTAMNDVGLVRINMDMIFWNEATYKIINRDKPVVKKQAKEPATPTQTSQTGSFFGVKKTMTPTEEKILTARPTETKEPKEERPISNLKSEDYEKHKQVRK